MDDNVFVIGIITDIHKKYVWIDYYDEKKEEIIDEHKILIDKLDYSRLKEGDSDDVSKIRKFKNIWRVSGWSMDILDKISIEKMMKISDIDYNKQDINKSDFKKAMKLLQNKEKIKINGEFVQRIC